MDKVYYDDLPHITKNGKNNYSAETFYGNWYEETVRNTLKRNDFFMRRDCGDLTIQRTQTMVDLLLKPADLSPHADGYLHYGDQVQIMSPGPSCETAIQVYPFKRNYCKLAHLALSSTVPPEAIDHAPYLSTDSIMTVSPLLYPTVRNSFIIERPNCPEDTSTVINYGDVFRIKAFKTQYFPLYVFSAPGIRLHAGATHSAKPKVRFSDVTTSDTLWSAHPLDPMDKLKMGLGVPIPMKTRLLIKHNGSGHNLSTEINFPVLTYFGSEFEVSVDSKVDTRRRPTFENIWYFDTERGWPKTCDPADKAFLEQAKLSAEINVNNANRSAAESAKEEAESKAEENENEDEDETCNQAEQQNFMMEQQQQMQQQELEGARQMMGEMSLKSPDGLKPYDPRTAPQPHAYDYKVEENNPYFPNQKWNCGDTDCCGGLPKLKPVPRPPCDKCECIEPAPPGESPNAVVPFKRLIM